MGELIYYVATSIDGYIADRDGGVDWLPGADADPDGFGMADFYAGMDALVVGRRTYEQILGFGPWPYGDKPCYVMTRQPLKTDESNVEITADSPGALLERIERNGHLRTWLIGGGELARAFHDGGWITEYYLSVVPHILGGGVPAIPSPATSWACELVECKTYPAGLVQLRYRPVQDGAVSARDDDDPMAALLGR